MNSNGSQLRRRKAHKKSRLGEEATRYTLRQWMSLTETPVLRFKKPGEIMEVLTSCRLP